MYGSAAGQEYRTLVHAWTSHALTTGLIPTAPFLSTSRLSPGRSGLSLVHPFSTSPTGDGGRYKMGEGDVGGLMFS